jgi:hypothetical protein
MLPSKLFGPGSTEYSRVPDCDGHRAQPLHIDLYSVSGVYRCHDRGHDRQRGFQTRHPQRRVVPGTCLALVRVRGMVCGDDIESAIQKCCPERVDVAEAG